MENNEIDISELFGKHSHSAYYQSILSGNPEQLKHLIEDNKLGDYKTNFNSARILSDILSFCYEELKVTNTDLSTPIEHFIVQKIIEARFLAEKTNEAKLDVMVTLKDIQNHIVSLNKTANDLIKGYSNKAIDDIFIYKSRSIARYIHTLKYYLKKTYCKLPWEEISFCVTIFVAIIIKPSETDEIYKLVLDKTRLLEHLEVFIETLKSIQITVKDINPRVRLAKRSKNIKTILNNNKKFERLFHDYELIKDVFSLRRIEFYTSVVSDLHFEENEQLHKFAIERTLQVIGETLKSTTESANVSNEVDKILLTAAPPKLKEIITTLRNALSHADVLKKLLQFEAMNYEVYKQLQTEIGEVRKVVNDALQKRKVCAVTVFLKKLSQYSNLEEIKETLINNIEMIDSNRTNYEDMILCLLKDTQNNLNLLKKSIDKITAEEEAMLEQVCKLIHEQRNLQVFNMGTAKEVPKIKDYLLPLLDSKGINFIKVLSRFTTNIPVTDFKNRSTISQLLESIRKKVCNRQCDNAGFVNDLITKISKDVMMLMGEIKGINKFNVELNDEIIKNDASFVQNEIDSVLSDIIENSKVKIEKATFNILYANKQLVNDTKTTFLNCNSKLLKKYDEKVYNHLLSIYKQLGFKNDTQENLLINLKQKQFRACKDIVSKIDDPLAKLIKTFADTNIFKYEKRLTAMDDFLTTFKLEPEQIKQVINYYRDSSKAEIKKYYNERLFLLKNIFSKYSWKNSMEMMQHFTNNKMLQLAIELIVLDLLNILEYASRFIEDRLAIEGYSPLLLGKSLRNYLAHGSPFIDCLPFDPNLDVICNAFKLLEEKDILIEREDILIGQKLEMGSCKPENTELITKQIKLFKAAKSGSLRDIKKCLEDGSNIFSRNHNGLSVIHFTTLEDNLENFKSVFKFIPHIINSKDLYGNKPLFYVLMFGSIEILKYYFENSLSLSFSDSFNVSLLHIASMFGRSEVVRFLLEHQPNLNEYFKNSLMPLHLASKLGHENVVEILLEAGAWKGIEDALKTDNASEMIRLLIINGCTGILKKLVEKGININYFLYEQDYNSLHVAVVCGKKYIVELLIQQEVDLNATTNNGYTPLFLAVLHCQPDIAKMLLNANADINVCNNKKETPLYFAAANNLTDIVGILLEKSPDVDKRDQNDLTPFLVACSNGHTETVRMLLQTGANINFMTKNRTTSLHLAAENGHSETVKYLLEQTFQVNVCDDNNLTPLHKACLQDKEEVVEVLTEHINIDLNCSAHCNMTPLHIAAQKGNKVIVEYLLTKGAAVNNRTDIGCTPLYLAVNKNHYEVAKLLLLNGAEPNIHPENCFTPFQTACSEGNKEMVELFRPYVEVNATFENGCTALQAAIRSGHLEIVSFLINNGAIVNKPDSNGFTPLLSACAFGYVNIVEVLLENGADISAKTVFGHTVVHAAVSSNNEELLRIILNELQDRERLDEINIKTNSGYTPLFFSVEKNYPNLCEVLLEFGADIRIPKEKGVTVLDVALGHNDPSLTELLQKGGLKK